MTWKPKQQGLVTSIEVATAKALLPPNPAWHIGLIQTDGHIEYIGAMHPNASGQGTHPGVEVWTDIPEDQVGAKPMAEDLGTSTVDEIETVLAAVEATGKGYPRNEVYSVIMIESGWKPHNYYHSSLVKPENAAGGLIGFMPFVLKSLGWTEGAIAFRKLSTAEQAPWVAKYFAQTSGWKYPGDTYVATAAAGYVGKPPDTVVYVDDQNKNNDAWDLNKVWDIDKDHKITVGELRQVLLTRMKQAPSGGTVLQTPKAPDDELVQQYLSEWRSLLALSLLQDAAHKRYAKLPLETEELLRRFQLSNGLKADGIPGPLTLAKLFK